VGADIYFGALQLVVPLQMFVLGPRLIINVREYRAKLVGKFEAGTVMTTIVFQERVHASTGGGV